MINNALMGLRAGVQGGSQSQPVQVGVQLPANSPARGYASSQSGGQKPTQSAQQRARIAALRGNPQQLAERQAQMKKQAGSIRQNQYAPQMRQRQQAMAKANQGAPSLEQWARRNTGGWYGVEPPKPAEYVIPSDRRRLDSLDDSIKTYGINGVKHNMSKLGLKGDYAKQLGAGYIDTRAKMEQQAATIRNMRQDLMSDDSSGSFSDKSFYSERQPTLTMGQYKANPDAKVDNPQGDYLAYRQGIEQANRDASMFNDAPQLQRIMDYDTWKQGGRPTYASEAAINYRPRQDWWS